MACSRLLDRARRQLVRATGRFARAEDGATAVEFAIVAIPFLVLVFAIIELGLVFLVSVTLENAVIDVGRTIRTGEAQTGGATAATFKTAVCNKMGWVGSSCDSSLSIDVQTFSDYAASSDARDGEMPKTMTWNMGTAGSIVLIRAYYSWNLITPMLQTGLQSANGKRMITAATAFTNEPYNQ
jgi:Flp pilus assembly protein TadG